MNSVKSEDREKMVRKDGSSQEAITADLRDPQSPEPFWGKFGEMWRKRKFVLSVSLVQLLMHIIFCYLGYNVMLVIQRELTLRSQPDHHKTLTTL